MEAKSVVKVGLVALIALVLFGGAYFYLSHYNPNTYTIKVAYKDTLGLTKQGVVRMRGVAVGEVKDIELVNLQPIVTLSIQKSQRIPSDSKFYIVSGILITNPQVDIRPGTSATSLAMNSDTPIPGEPPSGALEALSPELATTVAKFNKTFDVLNTKFNKAYTKIDHILDQTTTLVTSVNKTVNSTNNLLGDPKLKSGLLDTVSNFKEASQTIRVTTTKLSGDLRDVVKNSKGSFENLTTKLGNILTRVDATLDDANTIVKKITEQVTDPRLQQSLQETAELARTTLARFNQIASDIHQLTGDPQLQGDLKQTVTNLKNATEKGDQALSKVNDILGNVKGGTTGRRLRFPPVQFVGNVSEQFDPDRLRVDVEGRIPIGQRSLLDLGFYDLGQDTRLILQAGQRRNSSLLYRYGLYASKLGAGLEWEPTPGTGIRADLYDTNRPRLDLRALFRVNSDASLWIGADALFRRPVPIIGFQLRR